MMYGKKSKSMKDKQGPQAAKSPNSHRTARIKARGMGAAKRGGTFNA